jgi:hypothetical protein
LRELLLEKEESSPSLSLFVFAAATEVSFSNNVSCLK